MEQQDRFWSKVDKNGPDGCWLWTASKNGGGYGNVKFDGWMQKAHRVAYELLVGPIPDGLELDHLCRVKHCVRPSHLEPVTHAENVRRGELWKVNGAKAECPQGHPYSGSNLYVSPAGGRSCRTCHLEAVRRWRAKRRAA